MTNARIVFAKAVKSIGFQAVGTPKGSLCIEITKGVRRLTDTAKSYAMDYDDAVTGYIVQVTNAMVEVAEELGMDVPEIDAEYATVGRTMIVLRETDYRPSLLKPMTEADWMGFAGAEPDENGLPPHIMYVDDEIVVTADKTGVQLSIMSQGDDGDEFYHADMPSLLAGMAVAEHLTRDNFRLYGLRPA